MTKFIIFTVVVFAAFTMSTKADVVVNLSESKPVNAEVTALVARNKEDVIKKICDIGSSCPSADATIVINSYKTHIFTGVDFFISVTIDDFIYHVNIFHGPLSNYEKVSGVRGPKALTDEIIYFY